MCKGDRRWRHGRCVCAQCAALLRPAPAVASVAARVWSAADRRYWLCCCRCKLWDAAANDTVGGRQQHKGPNGISKQMMERYSGMSASDRKAKLAAIKCTGLVNGLRLAALSRPNF